MDKSSMQIIVFFAMVVFVAVYVTITNNKRKQSYKKKGKEYGGCGAVWGLAA